MSGERTSSPTLVGRAAELAELERVWSEVAGGQAATVLVTGEAGIGKTRLVRELVTRVSSLGGYALGGGCVDLSEDVLPYAPFVTALVDLQRRIGAQGLARLAGPMAPELARLVPSLGDVPSQAPDNGSTGRLLLALETLLEGLAADRPLLFVVEDVHWADASTCDLLALLVQQLRGRVMLLLTLRTDELAHAPVNAHLRSGLRSRATLRLDLRPLDRAEQALQLSGILGVPPAPELLDRVYLRAEGNPFFAEELLALGPTGHLPSTVRELLLARLSALPAASQQVLRAAAAAGRAVGHDLLVAVSDLRVESVEDAVRDAVRAGLLVLPEGSADYAFRHALLHETVSGTLLPGEAARLHRRLAEVLTADPGLAAGEGHAVAGRIALHWSAAGDHPRTLRASVLAAAEAERGLAFPEALRHHERALELLDRVPDGEAVAGQPRYRLLWAAAETAHLAAHPERAAELAQAAIDHVDPSEASHRAYLHERLGRYLWMAARGDRALEAYERALALSPEEPPTRWRAATVSGYSQILMLCSRFEEARTWALRAIRLASQLPDARAVEGHARNNLGSALSRLGDVEGAVEQLLLARQIAEQHPDDVDDIARAIVNLHSVLFDDGRYEDAAEVSLAGLDVVERLGLRRRKGVWCRCDAAEALLLLGRGEHAQQLVDEADTLQPQGIDEVRWLSVAGQVALRRGDAARAWELLSRAHARGEHVLDPHLNGPLLSALVEALRWTGEPEAALRIATADLPRLATPGAAHYLLPLLSAGAGAAADLAAEAGVRRAAEHAHALDQAALLAGRAEVAREALPAVAPPAAAALLTVTAELSRARGEHDATPWERAACAWDALGERYRSAYARWHAAQAHLAVGDRSAATTAARAALRAADDGDAGLLREQVLELARRGRLTVGATDEGARAEPTDPYRLTRREREVLELVADGRSDRQIGAHLFISHRTVERHVSSLLAKLDARSRAEIAALAHRSGLVG